MRKFFIGSALLLCCGASAYANNLKINNTDLETDLTKKIAVVRFNISWENSYKDATSYDAVWVFIKYSTDGGTVWHHATLKRSGTTPTDFSAGSGTAVDIDVPTDLHGCFIHRNSSSSGTTAVTDVKLAWNYDVDGVTEALLLSKILMVKVLGIEMIYCPTANFYLGDGNGASESTNALHVTNNTSFQVTTSNTTSVTADSNSNDDIDTTPIDIDGDGGITGNALFPTGYPAFYVMKYEITEEQWVTFFNMLTTAQKANHDVTGLNGKNTDSVYYRNAVSWTSGDATTTRPDRAMNYLNWPDICALADWCALRPMTELEFEKAARGNSASVYGEFAWGDTTKNQVQRLSGSVGSEDGTTTYSYPSPSNVNMNSASFAQSCVDDGCGGQTCSGGGDQGAGPIRVGIFAASATTRATAGQGLYGAQELTGNVAEFVVTVGNSYGRAFHGTNGDGVLTVPGYSGISALETTTGFEGNATNDDWPGINANTDYGVTGGEGCGLRGGSWYAESITVSDRTYCPYNLGTQRSPRNGGRLARTA